MKPLATFISIKNAKNTQEEIYSQNLELIITEFTLWLLQKLFY